MRVGLLSAIGTIQVNLTVACVTGAVGRFGADAIAGYGIASRLDYLQIPLLFGFGTAVVTMVGVNVGADQMVRAGRIAWIGAAVAFGVTELIGLLAAIFPQAWLGLFSDQPRVLTLGTLYLRTVAQAYGAIGLGMMLYFASQGAKRVLWPVLAGTVRMTVAAFIGWLGSLGSAPASRRCFKSSLWGQSCSVLSPLAPCSAAHGAGVRLAYRSPKLISIGSLNRGLDEACALDPSALPFSHDCRRHGGLIQDTFGKTGQIEHLRRRFGSGKSIKSTSVAARALRSISFDVGGSVTRNSSRTSRSPHNNAKKNVAIVPGSAAANWPCSCALLRNATSAARLACPPAVSSAWAISGTDSAMARRKTASVLGSHTPRRTAVPNAVNVLATVLRSSEAGDSKGRRIRLVRSAMQAASIACLFEKSV